MLILFFFFKQKTAYEMRISDWSSDVCSSDLERHAHPVLYPDNDKMQQFEWDGGVEDPRVVLAEDGLFVMTYTAYDGTARLCVATSRDLVHWVKHGPAFGQAFEGVWTKAGSIEIGRAHV